MHKISLKQVKPGFTNYLPRGLAKKYFLIKSSENFKNFEKKTSNKKNQISKMPEKLETKMVEN